MSKECILSIDQGTTGTTVLVIDLSNRKMPRVLGRKTVEFRQYYPSNGWVEHDLDEVWRSVISAAEGAISQAEGVNKFTVSSIAGVGITNQRETLCLFSRSSGQPLTKAIVWQDKRGAAICNSLRSEELWIKKRTGLVLDPYFSGSKIKWVVENLPDVSGQLANGEALLGTIDTFLLYKLTGCKSYCTESSNASRTLLFDTAQNKFDDDLISLFGVPSVDCLPEVKDSAGEFGKTSGLTFLPDGVPIAGILGDQQAALAGQGCLTRGEAKCTYGTGAFMLLNTGCDFKHSNSGLLSTIAWSYQGNVTYALEGSSFIAGAAIQFLRDEMAIIQSASESSQWAEGVQAAPDIYFVPALAGLGAPYWNPEAKGAFLGLSRGTTKAQMIRATLEGVAFAVADLYCAMKADFPSENNVIRVDGGAAANNILMQFQADCLSVRIERPANLETTALGAALFAALGVGIFQDLDDLGAAGERERLFVPEAGVDSDKLRDARINGWKRAIRAVQVFSGNND